MAASGSCCRGEPAREEADEAGGGVTALCPRALSERKERTSQ